MTNKFFKDFSPLKNFFSLSNEEQTEIEDNIKNFYTADDYAIAKFLGDEEGISLLLLWLGREYNRRNNKQQKKLTKLLKTFKEKNNHSTSVVTGKYTNESHILTTQDITSNIRGNTLKKQMDKETKDASTVKRPREPNPITQQIQ